MEEVLDLAGILFDPLKADSELIGTKITDDRNQTRAAAPQGHQGVQAGSGALTAEQVDRALAVLEELGDQVTTDEAGRAGDEVGHGASSAVAGGWRIHSTLNACSRHALDECY
jgi:hypothetical protein